MTGAPGPISDDVGTVLMTWRGTLLAADGPGSTLRQIPFAHAADHAVTLSAVEPGPIGTGPLAAHAIERLAHGLIAISRDGMMLRAGSPSDPVRPDRTRALLHESFLPIGPVDRTLITAIAAHDWRLASTGARLDKSRTRLEPPFTLALATTAGDTIRLDLRDQLPFLGAAPFRIDILDPERGLDALCLDRPLVVYTAFRNPDVIAQLRLSLRSLRTHGRYDGDVLILTDRTEAEIRDTPDPQTLGAFAVHALHPADRVGCLAARYAIADIPDARRHQPILYVDADIVFDAPIAPMLARIAAADRIAAPVETHSAMRSAHPAGADLLEPDEARESFGFNSGTLGIPNLVDHAAALRLVRRTLATRADLLGRGHFLCVDQPIANYVDQRTGLFDASWLHRHVRWGYDDIGTEPDDRLGLVHYWPPVGAHKKRTAMARYLEAIDG